MDDKISRAKENIANKLDFPRDLILNVPKISITGNDEITIENHKGIARFGEKEVRINSNVGHIIISGERFEILFLGGDTITIGGKFKSILYEDDKS
ncbi:sporulation protein YqfC [Clostridium sp. 19966]|uniref:sporulation protein YqfC n=1 Tax=Clostridium sp. 19966 TaxID=2768166 RepID=UPI0028DE89AF|nr:sporulation protein YqfC [Clostridium sp. 19966]MDT8715316.1 sporulation protein YqfC [Clostridium sp. 19966]